MKDSQQQQQWKEDKKGGVARKGKPKWKGKRETRIETTENNLVSFRESSRKNLGVIVTFGSAPPLSCLYPTLMMMMAASCFLLAGYNGGAAPQLYISISDVYIGGCIVYYVYPYYITRASMHKLPVTRFPWLSRLIILFSFQFWVKDLLLCHSPLSNSATDAIFTLPTTI